MKTHKYLIPDPPNPEGYFKICTSVPRNDMYLRQFFGMLAHMGKWVAWEENGEQQAKLAADTWKAANDLTHEAFAAGECDDMAFQLRQSPTIPCQLEQSFDGGENWTLAFDYRVCRLSMPVLISPSTGNDDQRQAVAGGIVQSVMQNIADTMISELNDSEDCEAAISATKDKLTSWGAGGEVDSYLADLCDELSPLTPEEREEYQGECPYLPVKTEMQEHLRNPNWLETLNDWLVEHLEDWNDAIVAGLNAMASVITAGVIMTAFHENEGSGGGGGAGFGGECGEWSHEWTGSALQNEWTHYPAASWVPPTAGNWSGTFTGWLNDTHAYNGGGGSGWLADIGIAFPATRTLTKMEIDVYQSSGVSGYTIFQSGFNLDDSTIVQTNQGNGTYTITRVYTGKAKQAEIAWWHNLYASMAVQGIRLYGLGSDPFE